MYFVQVSGVGIEMNSLNLTLRQNICIRNKIKTLRSCLVMQHDPPALYLNLEARFISLISAWLYTGYIHFPVMNELLPPPR